MGNIKSKILICGGLLLIAAALCLTGYNLWDAHRAADSVAELAQELKAQTDSAAESHPPAVSDPPKQETPAYILDPTIDMPTVELDGNEYIGILEIPSLELSLPVMSSWSYPKLKLAPCRYGGSAYLNDLIIAAHNYPTHFGALGNLELGTAVIFTDADGNEFSYTVSAIEQLPSTALEEMKSGDWELTLFTCTLGGKARVTARCTLDDSFRLEDSMNALE